MWESVPTPHHPSPQLKMRHIYAASRRLRQWVKSIGLPVPKEDKFGLAPTWIFLVIFIFAALIIMVLTFASTTYEPIAVFPSNFNGGSLLWYEQWFNNAAWLLPESWNCSGEIIEGKGYRRMYH